MKNIIKRSFLIGACLIAVVFLFTGSEKRTAETEKYENASVSVNSAVFEETAEVSTVFNFVG